MNIKFEYLYRDAGNYKNWGAVVFRNPDLLSVDGVLAMALGAAIDREFFVAEGVGLPCLYFVEIDEELDHGWHEISSFVETKQECTDPGNQTVEEFLKALRSSSQDCVAS